MKLLRMEFYAAERKKELLPFTTARKELECGEPFQAWEMWLSPHLENQWGAK